MIHRYAIVFVQSALKEIRRLPQIVVSRLRERIAALADDPRPAGVEKIQGYEDHYRIRIGNYRVVYEVADQVRIITIVRVGHRKDVYRRL